MNGGFDPIETGLLLPYMFLRYTYTDPGKSIIMLIIQPVIFFVTYYSEWNILISGPETESMTKSCMI